MTDASKELCVEKGQVRGLAAQEIVIYFEQW
jgi:hypothetical protein